MTVLVTVFVVFGLIAALAAQAVIPIALRRGLSDQWRAAPPEARRRGLIGGGVAGVLLICGTGLVIAEPWGPHSILYVLLVGGGVSMVLLLGITAAVAISEVRAAKRRRASRW